MSTKPQNPGNIGQDKAVQDPEDAVKQEGGLYHDAVMDMSVEQRQGLDATNPQAPDPQPFQNMREVTGGRD